MRCLGFLAPARRPADRRWFHRKRSSMKVVCFTGRKGGVGKTTNSHAAAHGLAMLGIPSAYVLTDRRQLPSDETRTYSVIDGRTTGQLEQAVETAKSHNGQGCWSSRAAAIGKRWT